MKYLLELLEINNVHSTNNINRFKSLTLSRRATSNIVNETQNVVLLIFLFVLFFFLTKCFKHPNAKYLLFTADSLLEKRRLKDWSDELRCMSEVRKLLNEHVFSK